MEWATALIPPVTVLTALAAWYGYELMLARGRYFGLDPSVLDLSTREYVFRSASAVLGPLLYLLITALGLLWLHSGLLWALSRAEWVITVRVAAAVGTAVGVVVVAEGVRVIGDRRELEGYPVLRPLVLAAGALLVSYGLWAFRQTLASRVTQPQLWERSGFVLVIAVVLLSVFWSFSKSAELAGFRDSSRLYHHRLHELCRVVVYSSKALSLDGPGIQEARVTDPDTAYRWRYSGLRLLMHSAGKYFLLPDDWASTEDPAIVLPDAPGLRLEFREPEIL